MAAKKPLKPVSKKPSAKRGAKGDGQLDPDIDAAFRANAKSGPDQALLNVMIDHPRPNTKPAPARSRTPYTDYMYGTGAERSPVPNTEIDPGIAARGGKAARQRDTHDRIRAPATRWSTTNVSSQRPTAASGAIGDPPKRKKKR